MPNELGDRFAALARVAKDLNSISDRVSERLREVEERLRTLGLGVEVELRSHCLSSNDHGEADVTDTQDLMEIESLLGLPLQHPGEVRVRSVTQSILAYAKLAGTWRLVVRTYGCKWARRREDTVDFSESPPLFREIQSEQPLLDASRDVRLAAVEQLDALLEEIQKAAEDRIARVHRSMASEEDPELRPASKEGVTGRAGGARTQRRLPAARPAR